MKIDRDQMEQLATLAALGGQDSIKKLSGSERAVVKVVLETLKDDGQVKDINIDPATFNVLTSKMTRNLGSIPNEKSNFIVRFCKGVANVLGRTSSNKVAALIPAAIDHVSRDSNDISFHTQILSYLSKERQSARKDCESAWDKISLYDTAKNNETMKSLTDKIEFRIKTLADNLKGNFKNQEISTKIGGAIVAMGEKLKRLSQEPVSTLADWQCDLEDIYDGLFQSLVEITISDLGIPVRDVGVAPSGQAGQPDRIKTSEDPAALARDTIAKAGELDKRLLNAPLEDIKDEEFTSIEANATKLRQYAEQSGFPAEASKAFTEAAGMIDQLIFVKDKFTKLKDRVTDLSEKLKQLPAPQSQGLQRRLVGWLNELKAKKPMEMCAPDAEAWANKVEKFLGDLRVEEVRAAKEANAPVLLTLKNETGADIEITSLGFTYREKAYGRSGERPVPREANASVRIMIKKGEEYQLRQGDLPDRYQSDEIVLDSFGPQIMGKQEGKEWLIQAAHNITVSYDLTRDALRFARDL